MKIDVFFDTVCPWCRIGERNLKLAIQQWQGDPVTIRYHPFFLNANIPPEGYDFRSYMNLKGGGKVPLEQWFDAPRQAGAAVGLVFDFMAIGRAPNTLLSHRLIALTPAEYTEAMIDAIYAAYFEHGRDIGDVDVLVTIAAHVGLDAEQIRQQLLSDAAADEVLAAVAEAETLGITGVPFFVLNDQFAFSGAHPPRSILRVMQQAAAPISQPDTLTEGQ